MRRAWPGGVGLDELRTAFEGLSASAAFSFTGDPRTFRAQIPLTLCVSDLAEISLSRRSFLDYLFAPSDAQARKVALQCKKDATDWSAKPPLRAAIERLRLPVRRALLPLVLIVAGLPRGRRVPHVPQSREHLPHVPRGVAVVGPYSPGSRAQRRGAPTRRLDHERPRPEGCVEPALTSLIE